MQHNRYGPERGAVGDEVLRATGRLTTIGTLENPVAQRLRNLVGHVLLGLAPVRHAIADTMTEVSVGYPHGPLNGPGLHGDGPRPGERVAPIAGEVPVGSGGAPRFTLFAERGAEAEALIRRFDGLLDPKVRPPLRAGAVWLVRPDGYAACAAEGPANIADYLERLRRPAGAEPTPA